MFASMISVYAHNYSSFQEQGIFVMICYWQLTWCLNISPTHIGNFNVQVGSGCPYLRDHQ